MNTTLPSYNYKNEIINAVNEYDTVIITAETGSGKSTQVPQYLFDAGYDVIVTQPRRIACITLADRVSEEMENYGNAVGYHTAFESTRTPDTKILFCTDGLQMAKGIKNVDNTILVIDEVHEWNLNIETLIAWVKKFRKDGGRIKTILMSATVESEKLCNFYENAKCINIPGRSYDVEKIHECYDNMPSQIYKYAIDGKNVLAFVEGKKEIDDMISQLREMKLDAEILPLHGELSTHDQNLCFVNYSRVKVVVSTNIAQTSVTIPDIDVVVDNGKEKRIEVRDGIEGLFVNNISAADCLQRAGRAGRTKDGIYVLCSYIGLSDRDNYPVPEIQRLVLDKVILKLASVKIDARTLQFFHQPNLESIENSINTLTILGALDKNCNITDLGKKMVKMPVSVRFAKMLMEADKYGCVNEIIKAVSILEVGTLIKPKTLKKNALVNDEFVRYSDFTHETKSDILAEIDIYNLIEAHSIPNLKDAGINVKVFFRIKKLAAKLNQVLANVIDIKPRICVDRFDIIRCIFAGIPDQLFIHGYLNNYIDAYNHDYKLSASTCIINSRIIFGFPKTISYTGKWGRMQSMDIITMPTTISVDELIKIVGEDNIVIKYEEELVSYDSNTDTFSIPYIMEYNNLFLDRSYKLISYGDPEYVKYKETHKKIVDDEIAKRVIINNHAYEIVTYWSRRYPTVSISIEDLMKSDIKTLKTNTGSQIMIECCGFTNFNMDIIREALVKKEINRLEERVRHNLSGKRTASINLVINEFLDQIRPVNLFNAAFNIDISKWVGLIISKESVMFEIFDSEDAMIESTNEALQMLVGKTIREKYPDKKFSIKRNGKKIETKTTLAAKEEFHEYCQEIIKDVNKDNFEEQLCFLDEIFNECVEKFA